MIPGMKHAAAALMLALLATLHVACAPPAWAKDGKESKEEKRARKAAEQAHAQQALQRGEILPMARILELARAAVPGDLLKLELDNRRLVYKAAILTPDSRICKLELDARNGAVIKFEAK